MSIEVGFFGVPGKISYGKVHITDMRRPICKSKLRRNMEFQFCSNRVHLESVECERCKTAWVKRGAMNEGK